MCDFLSVSIVHEKTLGPHTTLQFADKIRQEARLPSEKIHKHHALLHQFTHHPTIQGSGPVHFSPFYLVLYGDSRMAFFEPTN